MVVPQLVSVNKSWTGVFNSQLTESYTTRYISEYEFTYKIMVIGCYPSDNTLTIYQERSIMEDKKKEVTLEDLQKQVAEVTKQVTALTEENKSLKEQVTQKDLEITKLTLGGVTKQVTNVVREDEEIEFDFDY